jgi:phage-related protein
VSEVGTAYVRILPSAKGFSSALRGEVATGATVAGKQGAGAFKGAFMAPLKGLAGPMAAVFGGVAVMNGFKSAIAAASDLGESVNAVRVSYGEAADGVLDLSKKSAQALGLSSVDFNSLAVRFSAFSKTIAGEGGNVVGTLEDLTGRAADFASVMNLEVNEAAELFQSGLAGETEPLRRFGIDLSAAAVQAYAYANGIGTAGKELTESEKVQARYGLLMESTAKTQGDFANTSDGLANTLRRLGAKWDDVKARIGQAFLPAVTAAASFLETGVIPIVGRAADALGALFSGGGDGGGGLGKRLAVIRDAIGAVAEVLTTGNLGGKFAAVFQGEAATKFGEVLVGIRDTAIRLWEALQVGAGNLAAFWNGTLLPIIAKVASIVQSNLAPAFAAMADFVSTRVLPAVRDLASLYMEHLHPAILAVVGVVGGLVGALLVAVTWIQGKVIPVVMNIAGPVFGFLVNAIKTNITVTGMFINAIVSVVKWVVSAGQAVWNFATSAVSAFGRFRDGVSSGIASAVSLVASLPGRFLGALGNLGGLLVGAGMDLIRGLGRGIENMLGWVREKAAGIANAVKNAAKAALGIASPSRVFIEIGRYAGQGLAIGLSDTRQVEAAARGLASAAVVPVPVAAGGGAVPVAGAAAGGGGGRTINVYGPLESQVAALRRAERYDDILRGFA